MPNDPFYKTRDWYKTRAKVLSRDGWQCKYCGACVRTGRAFVDHIIKRKARPDLSLDLKNLQTLCEKCHNKTKQIQEANDHKPAIGINGLPPGWE